MLTNTQTFVSELTPATLEKKGVAYAPRTLASLVYMNDGTIVSDILEEMISNGKRFILRTKTEHEQVSFDSQRIYEIPTPLERYDFDKFPLIVSINNVIVNPDNYSINENQLILSQEFSLTVRRDDIITFIFHYLDIIVEDSGLNAESVNNVRFYVSNKEPKHKKSTDVWFDTTSNQVKQYINGEWRIIVSGNGNVGAPSTLSLLKSTSTITSRTPVVNIGVSGYNKTTDILFVYVNSTYLEEGQDYIIEDDRIIRSINGDWDGTQESQVFNFVIIKNITQVVDNNGNPLSILKTNSIIDYNTNNVNIGISNYNKTSDILFVYLNSTYLEEGQDYIIRDDRIINVNGDWDGSQEAQSFNFIVFKNALQSFRKSTTNVDTENEQLLDMIKNNDSNECITKLFNIVKDCQSTITSLSKKIESLEQQLNQR